MQLSTENKMNNTTLSPRNVTRIDCRPNPGKTRISIVAHHDFSIDGLRSILASHERRLHIACMEPGDTCLPRLVAAAPDALMIQNEALDDPPERFLRHILDAHPGIRILVFGRDMDDEHLYRLVQAGAHGYINERMGGEHIKHALEAVIDGHTWIERHIMERFISARHDADRLIESRLQTNIERLCASLTRRETEILCQVVQGLAIKQIAERVHLSHQGVKMHLAKLFRKFGVTNRNQLILATFDHISPGENLSRLLRDGLEGGVKRFDA